MIIIASMKAGALRRANPGQKILARR